MLIDDVRQLNEREWGRTVIGDDERRHEIVVRGRGNRIKLADPNLVRYYTYEYLVDDIMSPDHVQHTMDDAWSAAFRYIERLERQ